MAEYFTPTQERFNDPYQQRIFDYGTVDSRVYLSRATNMILKAIGNNVVLNGFTIGGLSGIGTSIISLTVSTGYAIQDSTLVQSEQIATLTIDVSTLVDTTTGGAHLGVFLDYEYLETVESNPAVIRLYHISSDGMTLTPAGFDSARCLTLIGLIEFTKVAALVTAVSEITGGSLSINGTLFTVKGLTDSNINLLEMLKAISPSQNAVENLSEDIYYPAISGSIVDTGSVQTLTNKTLTSPIINSPTLSSPVGLISTGDVSTNSIIFSDLNQRTRSESEVIAYS